MFGGLKDMLASSGIKKVINGYLTGIGEVDKLDLDQKRKKIYVSLTLKGEDKPLIISIDKYELVRRDGMLFVKIHDISGSKEWLSAAVKKYASDMIPVPSQYADIIEKIL